LSVPLDCFWVGNGLWKVRRNLPRGWGGGSESLVALTILTIGTSLPELVTSAVAAFRGSTDIAVGNVVGSNIFNLLWVLGITSVIVELPFDHISNTDFVMVIFSSTLVIFALVVGRKGVIDRSNVIYIIRLL